MATCWLAARKAGSRACPPAFARGRLWLEQGAAAQILEPWLPAFAGMTNNPLSFLEAFQIKLLGNISNAYIHFRLCLPMYVSNILNCRARSLSRFCLLV